MKKLLAFIFFFYISCPIMAGDAVLAWSPGIIDPPDYPAPDGYYVYCSNNAYIDKDNPETYLAKVDVGNNLSGAITFCNKYRCFAVTAYKIYGFMFQTRSESELSNIVCRDFSPCIAPSSPILQIGDRVMHIDK